MNRREFIKAALAIPAIAALPAPLLAAEELMEDIITISRAYTNGDGIVVCETWRRAGGKVWKCVASENEIISLTDEPFCPWIKNPWVIP